MQLAIAIPFAAIVALGAHRIGSLSRNGAYAAFAIGTITFAAGGWQAALVLFAFFIPSIILSRFGRAHKRGLVDIDKHGARDAWQVCANGGVAAAAILASLRYGVPLSAAFAGALAAAASDTWGTEIGTSLLGQPRSVLTGRRLATGMSGGVTLVGTLGEIAGAGFIALVALVAHIAPFWPVAIGGILGAFVDSLLGASAQALRYCPTCARDCETNPHICGTQTTVRRGFAWFENDAVNFAATVSGAIIAGLLARTL